MKRTLAVLPIAAAVVLAGCGVSSDESVTPTTSSFKAHFAPLGGLGPFPTDLFFSGSTDGTLNIPVTDPSDNGDYLVAINALDGYSTTAPIFVPFSGPIDAASIGATDVFVANTTTPGVLTPGVDFSVGVSTAVDGTNQLMITLLRPLAPKSRYAVIVTTGITGGGEAASQDASFAAIVAARAGGTIDPSLAAVKAALDPVLNFANLAQPNGLGIPDSQIAVAFSFLTQSTSDALDGLSDAATARPMGLFDSGFDTDDLIAGSPGLASVYIGFIEVPYYLGSGTAALTGFWQGAGNSHVTRFNPTPTVKSTQRIPVIASIPNGAKPGAGWPVVLFMHGITADRTSALALADSMAAVGFAVVAIDQPLHGIFGTNAQLQALLAAYAALGTTERHFSLDAVNNTTGAPGSDGNIDTSGANFINLSSLLTSRDNLRQAAIDLVNVAVSVPNANYDGNPGGDFDASRIHFAGQSLGSIVGTTYLAISDTAQIGALSVPGGGIARLLRDSATFAPRINAGLAANGVVAGSQLYEQFMQAAQTVVDSGDPLNFAATAAANHQILLHQVVGGLGTFPSDTVIPNSATARLISAMGLTQIFADTANAGGVSGFVNFLAGAHSSLLDPDPIDGTTIDEDVFDEMQSQFRIYMASNGTSVNIDEAAIVVDTTP